MQLFYWLYHLCDFDHIDMRPFTLSLRIPLLYTWIYVSYKWPFLVHVVDALWPCRYFSRLILIWLITFSPTNAALSLARPQLTAVFGQANRIALFIAQGRLIKQAFAYVISWLPSCGGAQYGMDQARTQYDRVIKLIGSTENIILTKKLCFPNLVLFSKNGKK